MKSLFIHDACIYLVYPAWVIVKTYFTKLPRPEILSVEEARGIITLDGDFFSTISDKKFVGEAKKSTMAVVDAPFTTFQFRLLLSSARVVLPANASESDCDGVTLRCDADFLYEKLEEGGGNTDLFVHGLEVFTGVSKNPRRYSSQSSLLYPLSLRAKKIVGHGGRPATLDVDIEVLKAKAKFTDLSLAVKVGMGLMSDMKEISSSLESSDSPDTPDINRIDATSVEPTAHQSSSSTAIHCSGLSLLLIDNSERHFVGSKDLMSFSIADISYRAAFSAEGETNALNLRKLEVVDFLQSSLSPFRLVACSYANDMKGSESGDDTASGVVSGKSGRLEWGTFCTKMGNWGYLTPPTVELGEVTEEGAKDNLITIIKTENAVSGIELDVRCNTLVFQWNPATVIAMQRFLGRLKKEALSLEREFNGGKNTTDHEDHLGMHSSKQESAKKKKIEVKLGLKALGVCLNKEHQGRRLLRLDLEEINVDFNADKAGSKVVGASITSLKATDPSTFLADENREVFKKLDSGKVLEIKYSRGGDGSAFVEEAKKLGAPALFSSSHFSSSILGALASFRFNYLNSRTVELLDYLSNGLPGKGMGYTRNKAQDFYREKKDNLAISLMVGSPELVVPRNGMSEEMTKCRLGEVSFSSWVEDGGRRSKGKVEGFGGGDILRKCVSLDVEVVEEKGGFMDVTASISDVEATVKYSDWALFHSIMMENMKLTNKRGVENLERDEELGLIEGTRRVRYWVKKESNKAKVGLNIRVVVKQEVFKIVLLRNDDLVASLGGSGAYKLCKISLSNVECSLDLKAGSRSSMQLNIKRFNLVDLADRSSAFRDLIKGGEEDDIAEEIVVTVGVGGGKETVVGLWLHDLTVFALVKPMVELAEFFKVAWPVGGEGGKDHKAEDGEDGNDEGRQAEAKGDQELLPEDEAGEYQAEAKVGRFRLDITAHKPRIFLLVDESDPSTKALVLRGLAKVSIVNGVAPVENDLEESEIFGKVLPLEDVVKYKACSVKIDNVESYVNPGVDQHSQESGLGITLIEPVSCEIEYRLEKRPLHPNVRISSYRLSGVKTMLSYTDLDIINVVLKQWSAARAEAKRVRKEGARLLEEGRIGKQNRERKKMEEKRARELEGEREGRWEGEWRGMGGDSGATDAQGEYNVIFENEGKLGLVLRKLGRNIMVERLKPPTISLGVVVGDRLISIDGHSVRRTEFKTVTEMLAMLPRPLSVRFGRDKPRGENLAADASGKGAAFTIRFHDKFTGLSVKESSHGSFMVVVSSVEKVRYQRSTINEGGRDSVGNTGIKVPKVGTIVKSINGVMCNTLTLVEVSKWLSGKSVGNGIGNGIMLEVEFLELPSSVLGTVDRGTVSVEGFKVTVIDDREGRDMPLIKALVEKVQVEVGKASANGAQILGKGEGRGEEIYGVPRSASEVKDALKKSMVQKVSVEFLMSLDNYNPRVGCWEPLVEVGLFKVGVEVVGRDERRGRMKQSAVSVNVENPLMINMSDAGLEMVGSLTRSLSLTLASADGVAEGATDNKDNVMATATAGAALAFAKKGRGIGEEAVKPYVLRNMTGGKVSFSTKQATENFTVVENGGEALFEHNEYEQKARGGGTARVRTYDGKLPKLTLEIEGLGVMKELPMDRVGVVVRDVGGTQVAWNVEVEQNRRVMTVSSAIRFVGALEGDFVLQVGIMKGENCEIIGETGKGVGVELPLTKVRENDIIDVRVRVKEEKEGEEGDWSASSLLETTGDGVKTRLIGVRSGKAICRTWNGEKLHVCCVADDGKMEGGILTVYLYASLSVENLLPKSLVFELADSLPAVDEDSVHLLMNRNIGIKDFVDCLGCDVNSCMPTVRFKIDGLGWSEWVDLPSAHRIGREGKKKNKKSRKEIVKEDEDAWLGATVDLVSQARDASGTPFSVGIRVGRKNICGVFVDALSVVLYVDCWVQNWTGLDLVIGAPAEQVFREGDGMVVNQSVGGSAMEAAAVLSDLVSVFDVGDKGKRLDEAEEGNFWVLPLQHGKEVWEEVFEYCELEKGEEVKRSWWGGENSRFARRDRRNLACPEGWRWKGGWRVCKAGGVDPEGWESCKSLNGGAVGGFKGARVFNPSHLIRRRRFVRLRVRVDTSYDVFTLQLHQPMKDKQKGKGVSGVVDSIATNKEDDSFLVALKLKDALWSNPISLSPSHMKNDVVSVYESRYLDLPGRPGGALGVHDLCYWSKRNGIGGVCVVVDSRFIIKNASKLVDLEVKQVGTDRVMEIGKGGSVKWSWSDRRLVRNICVRVGGDPAWKWSGGFRIDSVGTTTVRVEGSDNLGEGKENERLIKTLLAHSSVRRNTANTGAILTLQEEMREHAFITFENTSPWPLFVKQETGVEDNKGGGEIFYRGLNQFGWEKPDLAAGEEDLILRLGLSPLDGDGVDARFLTVRVGDSVRLSPHKIREIIKRGSESSALQHCRVFCYVVSDGPRRIVKVRLVRVTVSLGSEVGTMFRKNQQELGLGREGGGWEAKWRNNLDFAVEETLGLVLGTDKGLVDIEECAKSLQRRGGVGERRVNAAKDFRYFVFVNVGELIISMVDSSPNEVAVIVAKDMRTTLRWTKLMEEEAVLNCGVKYLQLDNHMPGCPYHVAISPVDQLQENVEFLTVSGVLGGAGGMGGILNVRHLDVRMLDVAVKLDITSIVRMQIFWLKAKGYFGKGGTVGWEANEILDEVRGRDWVEEVGQGEGKEKRLYFDAVRVHGCSIVVSVNTPRALREEEKVLEGALAAGINEAVRKGDVGINDRGVDVVIGGHNRTAASVVGGLFKNLVFDSLLKLEGANIALDQVVLRHHFAEGVGDLGGLLVPFYKNSLKRR